MATNTASGKTHNKITTRTRRVNKIPSIGGVMSIRWECRAWYRFGCSERHTDIWCKWLWDLLKQNRNMPLGSAESRHLFFSSLLVRLFSLLYPNSVKWNWSYTKNLQCCTNFDRLDIEAVQIVEFLRHNTTKSMELAWVTLQLNCFVQSLDNVRNVDL